MGLSLAVHADPATVNQGQLDIVSSNIGGYPYLFGLDINTLVGADRFYAEGYTGTRTIQANIEAEHIWNGHATLEHVQTQVTGTGALGTAGQHPTSVGQAMGGRETGLYPGTHFERGIASGATLWSGAIATTVYGNGSFEFSDASLADTYSTLLKTGVNGQTADVFNSSWSYTEPTGYNLPAAGIDGLLYQTGKIGVVAAGNAGPGGNSVGGIAAGYNSIAVAALGTDTDTVPYNRASDFSSRGPNDYYDPTGFDPVIPGVRARIDIAAPGQDLTLAIPTPAGESGNQWYLSHQAGTSFAAPIVAGGASLVVDAGKALYAGNDRAIDGRVVKAVLLNGADKTEGWDNGQQNFGGVTITTQSLDYATGAGRMNLDRTYDQYVDPLHGGRAGTTDVSGTTDVFGEDCTITGGDCALGHVDRIGWDFGWSNEFRQNTYFIDGLLSAGETLTATLDWFADIDPGSLANFSGAGYKHLANLDLWVFRYDPFTNAILDTVAMSMSIYNQVEHLSFLLPDSGYYGLQVRNVGDLWNFSGATGEYYGLAWSVVPEPGTLLLFLGGVPWLVRRRGGMAWK